MRVAVIGTGPTGRLAALELAEAGHHVDLFPGDSAPPAALGQIHLGFAGPSGSEVRALPAAAALGPLLDRWLGPGFLDRHGATGCFLYLLPPDGPAPETVRARFAAVSRAAADLSLPVELRGWRELTAPERDRLPLGPTVAAFATREGAFDPGALDLALAEATASAPRLQRRPDAVTAISIDPRGLRVVTTEGDALYDAVLHLRPVAPGLAWHGLEARSPRIGAALPTLRILGLGGSVAFPGTARLAAPSEALLLLRDRLAPDATWAPLPGPLAADGPEGGRLRSRGAYHEVEEGAPSLSAWAAHRACARILGDGDA
ncbi:FAD-dependent oxidoreductase [Rubellimicrobium roseum]|uniref:FAD-binding oxidoreductase n=1 Tax=Rubellimicrobium roseum TaxID=687525 RepID=A0A5C4NFS2_9RHOB|nr:FAD-dependent oxidoreductase [Rubellimicrobium roseum]TNC72982.1 FAD-binding oxidoreductase [Rubellimicrobium roseum]